MMPFAQFIIVIVVLIAIYVWVKPWRMHLWAKLFGNFVSYGVYLVSFLYLAINALSKTMFVDDWRRFTWVILALLAAPMVLYLIVAMVDPFKQGRANESVEAIFMAGARLVAYLIGMILIVRPLFRIFFGNRIMVGALGEGFAPIFYLALISAFIFFAPWALDLATPEGERNYIPWPRGWRKKAFEIQKIAGIVFFATMALSFLLAVASIVL